MRADAVARQLVDPLQLVAVQAPDADQPAARFAGVVLGAVQPLAAAVEHRVALEVAIRRAGEGLQQTAVTGVDQVALAARPAADEQRQRQRRVRYHVVAALGDRGGELPLAVEAIADRIVPAVGIVARRQQQRRLAGAAAEGPATEGGGGKQGAAEAEKDASSHAQSPSWALKPSWMPSALASSASCRRCRVSRLSYSWPRLARPASSASSTFSGWPRAAMRWRVSL
ncbi:hypothetical protein D3C75_932820 [compost metagenome]